MKLGQIEQLIPTLSTLKDKELPLRVAYKISLLMKAVENDYNFYMEEGKKILKEYAQVDSEGKYIIDENGNIPFKEDCVDEAQKKVQELKEIEGTETNLFFTLDEFDGISLTPAQLQPLLPFIIEE